MRNFTLRGGKDANNLIDLTPSDYSYLTEFTGFEPVRADLFSQQIYNRDGAVFQSSKGQVRNIVLTVYLFRDVELNRQIILNAFTPGEECTLEYRSSFLPSGTSLRRATGYVETIEFNRFEQPQRAKHVMQISITCFNPYFEGTIRAVNITQSMASVTLQNNGTAPCTLDVLLTRPVEPISTLTVALTNGKHIDLDFSDNPYNESIRINSSKRSITGARGESLMRAWVLGSEWLTFTNGEETLTWSEQFRSGSVAWTPQFYSAYD